MALGKGLGSLIPLSATPLDSITNRSTTRLEVDIEEITTNPQQPRQHIDHQALEDLINSIKEHGIIQPLVVTQSGAGYELIAGERRLRAAKIAGLKTVPVMLREASDLEKLELALIENIQRTDLNPIEKALGYKKLVDEFNLTQEEAARKIGISRSALANMLRMLNLPPNIQQALQDGKITEGHAKIILSLETDDLRKDYFRRIVDAKLSVRDLEKSLDQDVKVKKKKKKTSFQDPQLLSWQEVLSVALGTKVNIRKKGEGGELVVEFYSLPELKNIVNKISNQDS
jgi:ParB family chromosome partitioning protein